MLSLLAKVFKSFHCASPGSPERVSVVGAVGELSLQPLLAFCLVSPGVKLRLERVWEDILEEGRLGAEREYGEILIRF